MFAESPDNRHNSAWLRPFYMKTLRLERGLNETATIRKEDTFTARRGDVVTHACFRGRGSLAFLSFKFKMPPSLMMI